MKRLFLYFLAGCCGVLSTCFVSCEADVDLGNIDMTANIKTALSLPIGSMKLHFGDIIGDTTIQKISIDEYGRYLFVDTLKFDEPYHMMNLEDYTSYYESSLNLYQRFVAQCPELSVLPSIPADASFYLDFPITFRLRNMNHDVENQRIDSIIVDLAQFQSKFGLEGVDLSWSEIDSIEIRLSEDFRRAAGSNLTVSTSGYNFHEKIPISVDDFNLILMKDINALPSNANVKDSVTFTLRFYITPDEPLTIKNGDKILYSFELDFFDYSAVFGYFDPSNKMRDSATDYLLADAWPTWNTLNDLMLPLREPKVTFRIQHSLAMPLFVDVERLNLIAADSVTQIDATFNGETTTRIKFPSQITLEDPIDKRVVDTIVFDHTEEHGNLDELFAIHPIKINYAYSVMADTTTDMKQFRMTDNTHIDVDAIIEAPLDFNEGVNLSYSDTIDNIYIEEFTLRSLLLSLDTITEINVDSTYDAVDSVLDVQEAHLQLFLTLENWIPFQINASFQFLDENNRVITFNGDAMRTQYDLTLNSPAEIVNGEVVTPEKSQLVLAIGKGDFKNISSIRRIVFSVFVGDNTVPAKITTNSALRAYVGISANVDAIVNMEELFGKKETESLGSSSAE